MDKILDIMKGEDSDTKGIVIISFNKEGKGGNIKMLVNANGIFPIITKFPDDIPNLLRLCADEMDKTGHRIIR